jgi:hypothetical protein
VPVVDPKVLLVLEGAKIVVVAPPYAVTTIGSANNVKPAVLAVMLVTLGNAKVAFLIAVVPVMAPMTLLVDTWNASTDVMFALNNVNLPVDVEATVGLAPFIFTFVAFPNVIVALFIEAVPELAPMLRVVAPVNADILVTSAKIVIVPALPVMFDALGKAMFEFLIAVVPVVAPIVLLVLAAKITLVIAPPNAVTTIGSANNVRAERLLEFIDVGVIAKTVFPTEFSIVK